MLNIIQPVNELRFTSKSDFTTPCSKLLLTYSEDRKKKMLGVKTTQSPFDLIYPLERVSLLRYKISLHAVQQNSSYSIILSRFYSSGYR